MQAIITKNAQQIANNSIVGIEDATLRKRLYIYSLVIESLVEFFENAGYFTTTKESLYKNPIISKNLDIADFRIDNTRIDIRIMDNLSPTIIIPQKHKKLGIEPDFYFVVKIDENLKNISLEGFIPTESLTFDKKIQDFYVLNSSKLIKFDRFKQVFNFTKPKSYSTNFEEEEIFKLYQKLTENNLELEGQRLLFHGLLSNISFIKKLNTIQKIDTMAKNIKLMPTLLEEIIPSLTEHLTQKIPNKNIEILNSQKQLPFQELEQGENNNLSQENSCRESDFDDSSLENSIHEDIPSEEIEIYENEEDYEINKNEIDEALSELTTSTKEEVTFLEDDYISKIENIEEFEPYAQTNKKSQKSSAKPLFLHLFIIFLLGATLFSLGIFKKPLKNLEQNSKNNYNAVIPNTFIKVNGISWGITQELSQNKDFVEYLNNSGKIIEDELSEGLQTISTIPEEKEMKISIIFDNSGILKNIMIKKSSGSKEVDKKAYAIIKEILERMPPEDLELPSRFVRSILLINFTGK